MAKMTAEMAWQQAQTLDEQPPGDVSHIPGHNGLPIIGDALKFFNDPIGYNRACIEKYGPVFRNRIGPHPSVNFVHPDAQKMLTLDPDQLFSAEKGYGPTLGVFFPDGLLLRDFSDHRMHRRIMQSAFKNAMLETYMSDIHRIMRKHIQQWAAAGEVHFVQCVKAALLEIGSHIFLGMKLGDDSKRINQAFIDMAEGSSTPFRFKIPGTVFYRAHKGYEYMSEYFRKQIPAKRASDSTDMFSLFCKEKNAKGEYFSDDDLVHHVNFLLFAAHDTTTSTLSTLMMELMKNPEWQQNCREELMAIDAEQLHYEDLGTLEKTTYCFKETLRLYPPVAGFARRTLRDFEFMGHQIPANSTVTVSVVTAHRLEEFYKDPDSFDPMRFAPGREEHKAHPFAWFPFGGGAHKCIGLHFAEMLVKVALFEMLRHYRFESDQLGGKINFVPFPKPVNNLPLKITALN